MENMGERTVWDTSKAFIRDLAIEYRIRKTKEKNKKYSDLLTSLKKKRRNVKGREMEKR